MKLNYGIARLLVGCLVGCSGINQENTVQPLPNATQKQKEQVAKEVNVPSPISTSDSIGKAAKLTPVQVKELIEMEKRKAYKGLGSKEEVKAKFVLPTYLPPGFSVSQFSTKYNEKLGGRYEIIYCNFSKFCFLIGGGIPEPVGDIPISYETTQKISSPALGKVGLGYANYDRTQNQPHIGFAEGGVDNLYKDNNEYIFQSSAWGWSGVRENPAISLNEAIKIVESLQYLSH
jgi:hypothetical protein